MRVPGAGELLEIWERGQRQSLAERMLALLGAAGAPADGGALAALPIGRRDARLMDLRERLFGPQLSFVTGCPACGSALESEFALADIRVDGVSQTDCSVAVLGCRARFRVPTSSDLLALTAGEYQDARAVLLERCLLEAHAPDGTEVRAEDLPQAVTAAVAAAMAAADPQADVELALSCPACSHGWPALFDIASFLWKELHAWAKLMLGDVHELARAYGWAEADILALSPTRRQIYLELARQ
jgi:uncharacterized protein (UPF0212 family)